MMKNPPENPEVSQTNDFNLYSQVCFRESSYLFGGNIMPYYCLDNNIISLYALRIA